MFIGQGVQFGGGVQVLSDIVALPPIVTSGLQFNLMSAPTSGTTWTDASGNGRNATLQGSATYVSTYGGGIKLPNTDYTGNSYITVPYNISTSSATVEIVASFNPTTNWATIWGNENYNSSYGFMAYMVNASGITWGKPSGGTTTVITSSNTVRHWTFVINNTSLLLYLNGSQTGTTATVTAQGAFVNTEFLFGARHTNDGTGATDKMNNSNAAYQPVFYQMRVYNRALSSAEVTQNYTAIRGTYGI